MKKSVFAFFAASLCLAACQIEIVDPNVSDDVLSAQIEQKEVTKTVLGESNNVLWSENDQIVAFMKSSYGHKYQIKPSFAGKTYADFSRVSSASGDDLSAGMEWDHNVAYYPYSESIECVKSDDNYALEVVLPAEQTYEENSFGNGTWPMVAVSEDNNITFKNVCGGIKLQLKGTQIVKSITIQGKNNEKISGAATVTAYTDETKPAIVMDEGASTTVTLNCGDGVKLDEKTITEFIISLPPVVFSQGFTLTVTDFDGQTYSVETDKANTVLRSSLLVMPSVTFLVSGDGTPDEEEDELIIPVSYVNISEFLLELYVGDKAQLKATVGPEDATDKTVVWSSDNAKVAIVDQTGKVTAISNGSASISVVASGKTNGCLVTVTTPPVATADYVDEYGINHGKGTSVGMAVWAPVNCGYKAPTVVDGETIDNGYPYGKLYQWGRKYGQGYSGSLSDFNGNYMGTISDATVPKLLRGGVSEEEGNDKNNSDVFYYALQYWIDSLNQNLWNCGTEENPVKAEYDPCPNGWRVPTYEELNNLKANKSSWTTNDNQNGYWFSGASFYEYTEEDRQVFFPAAGQLSYSTGSGLLRGEDGRYWSSSSFGSGTERCLNYSGDGYTNMGYDFIAYGYSVRCVQE